MSPSQEHAADLLLQAIVGGEFDAYVEIRHRQPDGMSMAQRFFRGSELTAAARFALGAGQALDTYVGMAPRSRMRGRNEDVARAWLVSADCDDDASVKALRAMRPRPSIVVRSGGLTTAGAAKLHAHWVLSAPVSADALSDAKRKLAYLLGADRQVVDPARIMRIPGTQNFKADPPRPVEAVHVDLASRHAVADLVGHVTIPAAPTPVVVDRGPQREDMLLEIPAAEYIPALTGHAVNAQGFARCPFHSGGNERTPSLKAHGANWACYGRCEPLPGRTRLGGSIYTFAAMLHGGIRFPLRGIDFLVVQDALYGMFIDTAEEAA